MPPQPGQPERGWAPPPGHLELHSVKDHAKAHHAKAQNAHSHMPWTAAAKAELLKIVARIFFKILMTNVDVLRRPVRGTR